MFKDRSDGDAHSLARGGMYWKEAGSVNIAMSICSLRVYEPRSYGKEAAFDAKCLYDFKPDRNE